MRILVLCLWIHVYVRLQVLSCVLLLAGGLPLSKKSYALCLSVCYTMHMM